MSFSTREAWYEAAVKELSDRVFGPAGFQLPKTRVGCGWPIGNRHKIAGQCFDPENSGDKTYEIFISPIEADPIKVLSTLVHELCHTVAGIDAGHKKPFIEVAKTVGLDRPWTHTTPNYDLEMVLQQIDAALGNYPHAELGMAPKKEKAQGTRMLKVKCPQCEYIVRVTKKWLTEVGAPLCPTHKVPFEADPPAEEPTADNE